MTPEHLMTTAKTMQWLRGHLGKIGVRAVGIDCDADWQFLTLYGDHDSKVFTITECATWLKEGRNELLHQLREGWRLRHAEGVC